MEHFLPGRLPGDAKGFRGSGRVSVLNALLEVVGAGREWGSQSVEMSTCAFDISVEEDLK